MKSLCINKLLLHDNYSSVSVVSYNNQMTVIIQTDGYPIFLGSNIFDYEKSRNHILKLKNLVI